MKLLDNTVLVDHLCSDGFVSDWQRQSLRAKSVDFERNELLLELIGKGSYANLEQLIHRLVDTGQPHIARLLVEDGGRVGLWRSASY